MTNPSTMCRKHLLGEHVECHMLVGALARKKSIAGYIKRHQLEPKSVLVRHNALADEMKKRGYAHKSPLTSPDMSYLPKQAQEEEINVFKSTLELHNRCFRCKQFT